jgi:c-di-GMP-binding flagellar brake protein YcgR
MNNRRQFFRLELYTIPVHIEFENKSYSGRIKDLSGGGMSFYLEEDVHLSSVSISFSIDGSSFSREGEFIRKEKRQYGEIAYAVSFNQVPSKEESRLLAALIRLDAKRRKK